MGQKVAKQVSKNDSRKTSVGRVQLLAWITAVTSRRGSRLQRWNRTVTM